ncbi:MAG: hypothetical protein LCH46_04470 [Proteobacteria bacterium]|nr:hypothetical protein [Pseudomonadota bacterium]
MRLRGLATAVGFVALLGCEAQADASGADIRGWQLAQSTTTAPGTTTTPEAPPAPAAGQTTPQAGATTTPQPPAAASGSSATAPKDGERLPGMEGKDAPTKPGDSAPSGGTGANAEDPDGVLPNLDNNEDDSDVSVGEIPDVQTVELTADTAKKAIDAYVLVRDKYKDAALEDYENLQDFVDQTDHGKAFEADVKSFGFANVTEWNTAITMVGFAYGNILDDQSADIKSQIEEIKQDTEMAQDMRDRMVAALQAMIPSENNHKIVQELLKDPVYAEKIKLLETEDDGEEG